MLINALISTIIVSSLGCVLHFTYAWSHQNRYVGIFSAVNESTWEHIKIALFPAFAFFLILSLIPGFQSSPEAFLVGSAACLAIIVFGMPLIFYAYTAICRRSFVPIDIAIFFITIFLGFLAFFAIAMPHTPQTPGSLSCPNTTSSLTVCDNAVTAPKTEFYDFSDWLVSASGLFIGILILAAFLFSYYPPKFFIFRDPTNGQYGRRAFRSHHHRPHSRYKKL